MELNISHDFFRKQIPAELSFAMTIHKAQVQTLEIVYVNLAFALAHGQVYVALSRVKDSNHLYLI
jgi:ATP-dependent DNA helicase PIF1